MNNKDDILLAQAQKIETLKEKKELQERIIKAKIRKGGWEALRLYTIGVFKNVYNREFQEYWYHELIFRILWNVIAGKEKRYRDWETDRKSTRLNSSHITRSRMPSSA